MYLLTFKLQKIWTWRQRQSQTNYGNTYCYSIQENQIKQTYYKSSNKCIRKSSLGMIFILKFSFSYKFFISQFCLFLSFFESQVLLNVSLIAKCDNVNSNFTFVPMSINYPLVSAHQRPLSSISKMVNTTKVCKYMICHNEE